MCQCAVTQHYSVGYIVLNDGIFLLLLLFSEKAFVLRECANLKSNRGLFNNEVA